MDAGYIPEQYGKIISLAIPHAVSTEKGRNQTEIKLEATPHPPLQTQNLMFIVPESTMHISGGQLSPTVILNDGLHVLHYRLPCKICFLMQQYPISLYTTKSSPVDLKPTPWKRTHIWFCRQDHIELQVHVDLMEKPHDCFIGGM